MNTIVGRDNRQIFWSMLLALYGCVSEFLSVLLVLRVASADCAGEFSLRVSEEFLVLALVSLAFAMTCSFSCDGSIPSAFTLFGAGRVDEA